jgi:hypothetical protein
MPPPGVVPNLVNPVIREPTIIHVTIVFIVLGSLIVKL